METEFQKIINIVRDDPERGLSLFYGRYGKIMEATAKSFIKDKEETKEVVNDALVKIWRSAPLLSDIKRPNGWIYVVTANVARDRLRTHKERRRREELKDGIGVDTLLQIEENDSFDSLIRNLNEAEQAVMILKFVSQCTFAEIADELNKPLSTVSSIYYSALRKIKKRVKPGDF